MIVPNVIFIDTPVVEHCKRNKESLTVYTNDATLSSTYKMGVLTICVIFAALLYINEKVLLCNVFFPIDKDKVPLL